VTRWTRSATSSRRGCTSSKACNWPSRRATRLCTARLLIVRGSRQGLDGELDHAFASLTAALELSEELRNEALRNVCAHGFSAV
jgi:hypothetical protein